ncbi:hypothetical protein J5991_00370 [Methanocorpusculum sp.]|nr:hypothetical protein [Methanocorpusculum sp.]
MSVHSETFCREMQAIKNLLVQVVNGVGAPSEKDNLYLQFPESTENMFITTGATVEKEFTVNRRLKQLCVSVPENVTLQILNDGQVFAWFNDEAGTFDFDVGIYFGTLKVICTNASSDSQRWTCKLSFK